MHAVPFGEFTIIVQLSPVFYYKTSRTAPLLVRPVATGISEYILPRCFIATLRFRQGTDLSCACAAAGPTMDAALEPR